MSCLTLAQALLNDHKQSLVRQAEIIRDWPRSRERDEQAAIHVRLALWEQGMGRIAAVTQHRVYSILSFAMPGDAVVDDEPASAAELEREAAWEAEYFAQLERQRCPDCGDGVCPANGALFPDHESDPSAPR